MLACGGDDVHGGWEGASGDGFGSGRFEIGVRPGILEFSHLGAISKPAVPFNPPPIPVFTGVVIAADLTIQLNIPEGTGTNVPVALIPEGETILAGNLPWLSLLALTDDHYESELLQQTLPLTPATLLIFPGGLMTEPADVFAFSFLGGDRATIGLRVYAIADLGEDPDAASASWWMWGGWHVVAIVPESERLMLILATFLVVVFWRVSARGRRRRTKVCRALDPSSLIRSNVSPLAHPRTLPSTGGGCGLAAGQVRS